MGFATIEQTFYGIHRNTNPRDAVVVAVEMDDRGVAAVLTRTLAMLLLASLLILVLLPAAIAANAA